MKIEVTTKYNVGDVLYYAEVHWNIVKVSVKEVEVHAYEDNKIRVRYKMSNGEYPIEGYMDDYFDTPEGAGQYFAERAIENMIEPTTK